MAAAISLSVPPRLLGPLERLVPGAKSTQMCNCGSEDVPFRDAEAGPCAEVCALEFRLVSVLVPGAIGAVGVLGAPGLSKEVGALSLSMTCIAM